MIFVFAWQTIAIADNTFVIVNCDHRSGTLFESLFGDQMVITLCSPFGDDNLVILR